MVEDNVGMYFPGHLFNISDLPVFYMTQEILHLIRIFQIIDQGIFHAHEEMGPLKEAAGEHDSDQLLAAVNTAFHLFGKGPVQPSDLREFYIILPVLDIFNLLLLHRLLFLHTVKPSQFSEYPYYLVSIPEVNKASSFQIQPAIYFGRYNFIGTQPRPFIYKYLQLLSLHKSELE